MRPEEEAEFSGKYLRFSGTLQGRAYSTGRVTASSLAVRLLKQDLAKSLKVGVELTLEDLESSGRVCCSPRQRVGAASFELGKAEEAVGVPRSTSEESFL